MKMGAVCVEFDKIRNVWNVRKDNLEEISVKTNNMEEAIKLGRIISQRSHQQLIIYDEDGKIVRVEK
jgi:ABC-type lipoprotein release transport system permease subunit